MNKFKLFFKKYFPLIVKFKRWFLNYFFHEYIVKNELNAWKIDSIGQSVKKALQLQDLLLQSPKRGVIVECGVGLGWSLSILANVSKLSNKNIFAFDSFSGFPNGGNKDSLHFKSEEYWPYKYLNIDFVKNNLQKLGVEDYDLSKRITFKPGFFPLSFSGFDQEISFLHLDVDLYQSYSDCLEFFYPLIVSGGIILFDEYDQDNVLKDWPGAKLAIDEFVFKNNLNIQRHWTGFIYIIKD